MMLPPYSNFRLGLLFVGICAAYTIIMVRLVWIQVLSHDFFLSLGQRQYIAAISQQPARACIYDRNGLPLALNRSYVSACLAPRTLRNPEALYRFLERYFPEARERLATALTSNFFYIARRLSDEQQTLIEAAQQDDPALCEIMLLAEPGRYYPAPHMGPVVGITTIDNHGAFGLERQYDMQLAGTSSTFVIRRDARATRHYYFEKYCTYKGAEGTPLYCTLDSVLQGFAYEELLRSITEFNAREGMVIIMDPNNGDILAMVSYPDFDPNNTHQLIVDHTRNRCCADTYEFGSVIKTFLALAALAEGVVTPDTLIDCYNVTELQIQGMHVTTWKPHGLLTFSEVIQHSNNIGTAQVALLLKEKLYEQYRRCGFGTATGLLPGEQAGHVTHPSTWCAQSLASLSYGYEVRATLLQLACAWSMIARGGVSVRPRLIIADEPSDNTGVRLYNEATMQQLREILARTVQQGTAYRAQIAGYELIGKTGSAKLLVDGRYSDESAIYTFSGAICHGTYSRVVVTCIKEPRHRGKLYASTVAAPLFERIVERMLIRDTIIAEEEKSPLPVSDRGDNL